MYEESLTEPGDNPELLGFSPVSFIVYHYPFCIHAGIFPSHTHTHCTRWELQDVTELTVCILSQSSEVLANNSWIEFLIFDVDSQKPRKWMWKYNWRVNNASIFKMGTMLSFFRFANRHNSMLSSTPFFFSWRKYLTYYSPFIPL